MVVEPWLVLLLAYTGVPILIGASVFWYALARYAWLKLARTVSEVEWPALPWRN